QMYLIAGLVILVTLAKAQQQNQCLCSQFNPCFESASGAVQQCADRCQSQVTALGASYPAARQCILAHQGRIHQAVSCTRASFGNVCANSPGHVVPRRYPETLQLAAFREINSILTRSGLLSQATALLQAGRRVVGCMMKCGQQSSCIKRLGCGISLPADNIVVSSVKNCAIQAGFTTPVAREICGCLANAGIRQLAPLCAGLTIS
ncbi:hypothetical protein PENTCL1PPCAC_22707, partial [Pristionchus entomophagus]